MEWKEHERMHHMIYSGGGVTNQQQHPLVRAHALRWAAVQQPADAL